MSLQFVGTGPVHINWNLLQWLGADQVTYRYPNPWWYNLLAHICFTWPLTLVNMFSDTVVKRPFKHCLRTYNIPDCKVHVANMGPTWVLSAPGGPDVGPMNLDMRDIVPSTRLAIEPTSTLSHVSFRWVASRQVVINHLRGSLSESMPHQL